MQPHRFNTLLARPFMVATVGMTTCVCGLSAQERVLDTPEAVHGAPFAVINTVREQSDGRVLVADPLALVVVVLDPDLQTADTLGRLGEGPDEYRQPDAVWPFPGDSTLLVDLGNSRLTVIGPDGAFTRTMPIAQGASASAGPPLLAIPGGIDDAGRIYVRAIPDMTPSGPADSASILRLPPRGAAAPVVRVKTPSFTTRRGGSTAEQSVQVSAIPLSPTDVWAVAPDGWVAVARAADGRVDQVAPDGTIRRGTPRVWDPVPVRDAEKEEWAAARASSGGGIGIEITDENGRRSMRMRRGTDEAPDLDAMIWPDVKAPWVEGSGRMDVESRFWVRRSRPAGEPALYEVFDREAGRVGSVRLGPDRRIVGFGAGAVYVVHTDAVDLATLERYALPSL